MFGLNSTQREQFRDSVADYHATKQLKPVVRIPLPKSRHADDEFIKDLFAGYGLKVQKIDRQLFKDKIAIITKDQQLWMVEINNPDVNFPNIYKQELVLEE